MTKRKLDVAVGGIVIACAGPVWASAEGGHATFPWSAAVNLVLLIGILIYFLRKPLSQTFGDKRMGVENAVAEAEELRLSVEKMVNEYETKLARLDTEVDDILKEAREEGEKERQRILERARKSAERIRLDAERAAQTELNRTKARLEKEMMGLAAEKAAEMLRSRVSEKDHGLFTQELIHRLEEMRGPSH